MVYKSGPTFLPFCHKALICHTDRQTEFSSLDRVCIACSDVVAHLKLQKFSVLSDL